MSSADSLPQLDACVALYLDVWELFGKQSFTPTDLSRRVVNEVRTIDAVTGQNGPETNLDLLVAYGLLACDGEDRYRILCTPKESIEEWQRKRLSQLETLRQRIDRQQRQPGYGVDGSEDDGEADLLLREGAAYVSVRVDEGGTLEAVAADMREQLDRNPDVTGIALRCPAILTRRVQKLADYLCADDATVKTGVGRFEKVNSAVVGAHKDDLEYRLFLREMR